MPLWPAVMAAAVAGADPAELNQRGNRALSAGDAQAARALFEAAAALDPAPQILLNLSIAAARCGDPAGERAALERALAADPYSQLALLQLARWQRAHAAAPAAAAAYSRFLATVRPDAAPTPPMQAAVAEARAAVAADAALLATAIDRRLAGVAENARTRAMVQVLLGRERVYRSRPTGLYVPFLPEVPFFERALFPWFDALEGASEAIAGELAAVLAQDAGLEPYVRFAPGQPVNQWAGLNHSRAWSAFFLLRNGVREEENARRCPRTMALLAQLPLLDLPGRGPTAIFSILEPGAHIPPHTGATNARAVVHLPLVVPPDCGFRVGADTRAWRHGEAWAFDDTIEHEAWNRSDRPRAILILDAWNPYLSPAERAAISAVSGALDAHAGRTEWTA